MLASPRHGTDPVIVANAPEPTTAGPSKRPTYQVPRSRKLTPNQEIDVRNLSVTMSFRALAEMFDVSHETIRKAGRGDVQSSHFPFSRWACNGATVPRAGCASRGSIEAQDRATG